jgi:D-alanyl-D-alanine dipeptidase
MILLSDPRVAAIEAVEDGDPLIDLRDVPQLRLDGRAADADGASARLRAGVAERLVRAQSRLPKGLHILVVEGYRPMALQEAIIATYTAELLDAHPDWSGATLRVETSKFVAPVEVAPHGTGGAVDLTLCHADGTELDMGTAIDDTPQATADACFTAAQNISPLARNNRAALRAVLTSVGMVNYPTEWWHWSYGDRYWAVATGAPYAHYGLVTHLPRAGRPTR